jgi:hypothetical protein
MLIFAAPLAAQQVVVFQQDRDGYSGTRDAHILVNKADNNTGDEDLFEATGNGGEADAKHALIRFDLSSLPTTVRIDSAWLQLFFAQRRTSQSAAKTLAVFRLNRDWGEGNGNDPSGYDGRSAREGESNWIYAKFDAEPWAAPGANGIPGDRDAQAEDSVVVEPGDETGRWLSWTVTRMVQEWISNPDSNFGLVLREPVPSSASGILDFASSEYTVPYLRPTLRVRLTSLPETVAGEISETHSYNSITVVAYFTGDSNSDGSAFLAHRVSGQADWQAEIAMKRGAFEYSYTLQNLTPGSRYDVRVRYSDPDGVTGDSLQTIEGIELPDTRLILGAVQAVPQGTESIRVTATFSGDANGDGTATVAHRPSEGGPWQSDGAMQRQDSLWVKTIFGLSPDTEYEVVVAVSDPDGVVGPDSTSVIVRTPAGGDVVRLESWAGDHFVVNSGFYQIRYDKSTTDGYLLVYPAGTTDGALATHLLHARDLQPIQPDAVTSIEAVQTDSAVVVTLTSGSATAEFFIQIWAYSDLPGLFRWQLALKPKTGVELSALERDIRFYSRTAGQQIQAQIREYASQMPFAAGLTYLYDATATNSTILYLQDFSRLNRYYDYVQASPSAVVDASQTGFGYLSPPSAGRTLPADSTFVLSDAFLYLTPGEPLDENELVNRFLQGLAGIYRHMYKPPLEAIDWTDIVTKELQDLLDQRNWVNLSSRDYLRVYVDVPRFGGAELIAQLDVLVPLARYEAAVGNVTDIDDVLRQTLPSFFNPEHQIIVNNYPNAGVSQGDSWYTVHIATLMAQLALLGDETARLLLQNSMPSLVAFGRGVNYEFPVFFRYSTWTPISGREPDVAGGYAYLMLLAYDLFGDSTYLDEAKTAIAHLRGKGFDLSYELHMTAAAALASARLYEITGDAEYLRLSYLPIANLLRHTWLWESDYGTAKEYRTFFGLNPMPTASVITMMEQHWSWWYLREYMQRVGDEVSGPVKTLLDGFLTYTPITLKYSLPPFLPADAVSPTSPVYGSTNVPSFYIPLEDLRDGWQRSGQLGQQIYGAGGPLNFAAALVTGVSESAGENDSPPRRFELLPAYPNPFNSGTTLRFTLSGEGAVEVELTVYDLLGRRVRTLLQGQLGGGVHTARWDGRDEAGRPASSGLYFARLRATSASGTLLFYQGRKLLLLR